jgi:hypothetical protein
MTSNDLPELIKPTAPERTDEEYHELNMALASVLTTLKKHKNILIKTAQLQDWSQRKIEITLVYKPSVEQWKAYEVQERIYYNERRNREELQQAETFGITVEQLREAKRRHDVYQSKKCEKAPDYELDYFVEKILSTSDVPELAEP